MFQSMWNCIRINQTIGLYYTKPTYFRKNIQQISTGAGLFQDKKRIRPKYANPGFEKRFEIQHESGPNSKHTYDTENMESDYEGLGVGEKYEHKSKIEVQNEYQKLKIVGQKYFKTSSHPNFLTWAEKEQIRYLHGSDPDEWSADKLAQSFPASEAVIKKVIKSHWNPEDSGKILSHDKSVDVNWKAMLSGKLELESNLKAHLMRFAKREQATFAHAFMEQTEHRRSNTQSNQSEVVGEFSSIIKSYNNSPGKKLLTSKGPQDNSNKSFRTKQVMPVPHLKPEHSDTYMLDNEQQNNEMHFTLDKYREQIKLNGIHSGTNNVLARPKEDGVLVDTKKESLEKSDNIKPNGFLKPYVTNAAITSSRDSYPESIKIPKYQWKKGGTFKVDECYYDDDGEFLYRVPGMK